MASLFRPVMLVGDTSSFPLWYLKMDSHEGSIQRMCYIVNATFRTAPAAESRSSLPHWVVAFRIQRGQYLILLFFTHSGRENKYKQINI